MKKILTTLIAACFLGTTIVPRSFAGQAAASMATLAVPVTRVGTVDVWNNFLTSQRENRSGLLEAPSNKESEFWRNLATECQNAISDEKNRTLQNAALAAQRLGINVSPEELFLGLIQNNILPEDLGFDAPALDELDLTSGWEFKQEENEPGVTSEPDRAGEVQSPDASRAKQDLKLFYWMSSLKAYVLALIGCTYILYLSDFGLAMPQIILFFELITFTLIFLLLELPTGILADLYGRRVSVRVGSVLSAAALMMIGFLTKDGLASVAPVAVLFALFGAGVTFISGADMSWLKFNLQHYQQGQLSSQFYRNIVIIDAIMTLAAVFTALPFFHSSALEKVVLAMQASAFVIPVLALFEGKRYVIWYIAAGALLVNFVITFRIQEHRPRRLPNGEIQQPNPGKRHPGLLRRLITGIEQRGVYFLRSLREKIKSGMAVWKYFDIRTEARSYTLGQFFMTLMFPSPTLWIAVFYSYGLNSHDILQQLLGPPILYMLGGAMSQILEKLRYRFIFLASNFLFFSLFLFSVSTPFVGIAIFSYYAVGFVKRLVAPADTHYIQNLFPEKVHSSAVSLKNALTKAAELLKIGMTFLLMQWVASATQNNHSPWNRLIVVGMALGSIGFVWKHFSRLNGRIYTSDKTLGRVAEKLQRDLLAPAVTRPGEIVSSGEMALLKSLVKKMKLSDVAREINITEPQIINAFRLIQAKVKYQTMQARKQSGLLRFQRWMSRLEKKLFAQEPYLISLELTTFSHEPSGSLSYFEVTLQKSA